MTRVNTLKSLFVQSLLALSMSFISVNALADNANAANTKNVIQPVTSKVMQAIQGRTNNVIRFYKQSTPAFGKNEESVKAIEQMAFLFLVKPRTAIQINNFVQSYGAFYGQTLIQLYGGKWVYHNGALAIQANNGTIAYPYASIRNRLTKKQADSVYRDMMNYKQLSLLSKAKVDQLIKQSTK